MSDAPILRDTVKSVPTHRKAATPKAVVPPVVAIVKKPFSMSYDGTTTAEHVQYMIDRGAR